MSQEEPISRKAKKAQRDAERHKKSKKRKLAETDDQDEAEAQPTTTEDADQDSAATVKKSKKRKPTDPSKDTVITGDQGPASSESSNRPKKKRKKSTTTTTTAAEGEDVKTTKPRFILFIGNLSFKTTESTLRAHFKSLEPFTLRHLTDPKTKKSKGCAFIEFENYDRMKTCLKLYHHSIFDPTRAETGAAAAKSQGDVNAKLGKDARRINVELTAGGGGKTDARREKIKAKNVRLEDQRKRRAELERKERARKEKEGEGGGGGKKNVVGGRERGEEGGEEEETGSHGIHPSRLARMAA